MLRADAACVVAAAPQPRFCPARDGVVPVQRWDGDGEHRLSTACAGGDALAREDGCRLVRAVPSIRLVRARCRRRRRPLASEAIDGGSGRDAGARGRKPRNRDCPTSPLALDDHRRRLCRGHRRRRLCRRPQRRVPGGRSEGAAFGGGKHGGGAPGGAAADGAAAWRRTVRPGSLDSVRPRRCVVRLLDRGCPADADAVPGGA
jgi:hypothetical protein